MFFSSLHRLDSHCLYLGSLAYRQMYLVGGCIRDMLLFSSYDVIDIDATCSLDPNELHTLFSRHALSSFFWTPKYGTLSFARDDVTYEITPLRCEGGYDDARHPTQITRTSRLLDDAVRRDFSCNCLYYTVVECSDSCDDGVLVGSLRREDGVVVLDTHELIDAFDADPQGFCRSYGLQGRVRVLLDPYGGLSCLNPVRLACVGNPLDRLYEDSLRIIRALRFVSVLSHQLPTGCDVHKDTWNALKQTFHCVKHIAKERIYRELIKVLRHGSILCFVSLCDELNILKDLFPSLYACKNVSQPVRYHPFDVYAHTLLCLHAADTRNLDPYAKLSLVFHDVGKVDQYYAYGLMVDKNQASKVPARNHRNTSSILARPDLERLGLSRKEIDIVCWYIDHHHDAEQILASKPNKQAIKIKKLLTDCGSGEQLIQLWRLSQCDRIGQYNMLQRDAYQELESLIDLTNEIVMYDGIHHRRHLAINGHDLLALGYKPGPLMGNILDACFDYALIDRTSRNDKDHLLDYCKKNYALR